MCWRRFGQWRGVDQYGCIDRPGNPEAEADQAPGDVARALAVPAGGKTDPCRYNHWNDKTNAAEREMLNVCCTDWATAAIVNARAAKVAKRAADQLAAIPPPAGSQRAYRSYVATYRTAGFIFSDFAAQLHSQQSFAWETFNSRWTADQAPVTRFRLAVIEYAAAHRLPLPRWVHEIGGK